MIDICLPQGENNTIDISLPFFFVYIRFSDYHKITQTNVVSHILWEYSV